MKKKQPGERGNDEKHKNEGVRWKMEGRLRSGGGGSRVENGVYMFRKTFEDKKIIRSNERRLGKTQITE